MIKLVWFYNQGEAGWSETYYAPGDDPKLFASTLTPGFMNLSVAFRSQATVLKAIRLTRLGSARFSFLVRPYPATSGGRARTTLEGPDVASVTAVHTLYGVIGATRRVFFRGLFDGDVVRDTFGVDLPTPALVKGVKAWVDAMKLWSFSIRYLQRPPAVGLVWQKVVTLLRDDDNFSRTKFRLSPVIPERQIGDRLSVTGIPAGQIPGFPRNLQILDKSVAAGFTYYHVAYAMPGGMTVNPRSMQVTTLSPTFDQIEGHQFERFSEHKVGRPFGSLRGRTRSRALRI